MWKKIDGYNYSFSSCGRVRNDKTGLILKPQEQHNGYLRVNLYNKDGMLAHLVHRLVAVAFVPNPDNLPTVNHIDEVRSSNDYKNLEWCTAQYNCEYSQSREGSFIDPSGAVHNFVNIIKFCKTNGLDASAMRRVAKGIHKQHKGWRVNNG